MLITVRKVINGETSEKRIQKDDLSFYLARGWTEVKKSQKAFGKRKSLGE